MTGESAATVTLSCTESAGICASIVATKPASSRTSTLDRREPGQLERERIDTAGKGREAIAPFRVGLCRLCPSSNAGLAIDTVTPGRIAPV